MVAIVLPTTTMPGQHPQESAGKLVNLFLEALGPGAAAGVTLRRVPGMKQFGTTAQTIFRGGRQVGALAYSVWSGKVVTHSSAGGGSSVLTGTLLGNDPVFTARNNRPTPDFVIVSPANGAFVATTTAVSAYPDADVGVPVDVCFIKGWFFFAYGNGLMRASGLNDTSINTLDNATAESKPDILYRVIPRGDTLIAAGSESIEFWGVNGESTGFPYSPITTHDRGIIGRYALTGHEEGFGFGIFFVADDFTVRQLEGYGSLKISPPDLDRLIEAVADKSTIQCSVYVSQGHPFLVVQCNDWTWEYDVILQVWHERRSYFRNRWKGALPFKAFDKWLSGDITNGNLFAIDSLTRTENSEPLACILETGPMGSFPYGSRVNSLSLLCAMGVGTASGIDPIQTDPTIKIYISKDNGGSWSQPFLRKLGAQGKLQQRVTVNHGLGHCGSQGVKLRFEVSDPVHVSIMGGDIDVTPAMAA